MSTKVKVIARMTVTKTDGKKLIVEVHADATEHAFYHWYSQDGRKRKVFVRTSHRTDGAERVAQVLRSTPGLELLAERMKGNAYMQVKDIKIRILLKRAYKRMTTCSADKLGELPKCAPAEYKPGERPAKPLYPVTALNKFTQPITYFEKRFCDDCMTVHFVELTRMGRVVCHGEKYFPKETPTHYSRRSGRGFEVVEKNNAANIAIENARRKDPIELLADYVQDW